MTLFQLITLPLVILLFLRGILKLVKGTRRRGIALLEAVIWLLAGVAILQPNVTMRIANVIGIGRGADLILYILVIAYLISCFYVYNKFKKIESDLSEIVRQLAIQDALKSRQNSGHEVAKKRSV